MTYRHSFNFKLRNTLETLSYQTSLVLIMTQFDCNISYFVDLSKQCETYLGPNFNIQNIMSSLDVVKHVFRK